MITFHLEYTLDPELVEHFQEYAKKFVELTKKYGGEHYGYFINADKERTTALAMFTFSDVTNYNVYRKKVLFDPQYEIAMELARKTRCIKYCHRTVYDRKVA
jgi:hypothetical protein